MAAIMKDTIRVMDAVAIAIETEIDAVQDGRQSERRCGCG